MKKLYLSVCLVALLFSGLSCSPDAEPASPSDPGTAEIEGGEGKPEDHEETGGESGEQQGEGGQGGEQQDEGGHGEGQDSGEGGQETGGQEEGGSAFEVLDPGKQKGDSPSSPSHPDLVREEETAVFYDNVYDWLADFGNVDYVLSQGFGTDWPMLTQDGHLRLYQARGSKGGNYIRIRAQYDVRLLEVTLGSASATRIAYSLDGKARKSSVIPLEAGGRLTFGPDLLGTRGAKEICIYCMGEDQSERWELDYVKVRYSGGWTEGDFHEAPEEYGPLVRTTMPWKVDFEDPSFVYMKTNSYYKYGTTEGPEHLQWSTWYGCFSWQHPKGLDALGSKSAQLRVYQEDEDYDKSQFGYLKTEYFIKDLKQVSFDYCFSEFWVCATISYCDFGSDQWKGSQSISLKTYSDRESLMNYKYVLDGGTPHDAKIRIEIDEATGYPSKDHYDLIFDNFIFE